MQSAFEKWDAIDEMQIFRKNFDQFNEWILKSAGDWKILFIGIDFVAHWISFISLINEIFHSSTFMFILCLSWGPFILRNTCFSHFQSYFALFFCFNDDFRFFLLNSFKFQMNISYIQYIIIVILVFHRFHERKHRCLRSVELAIIWKYTRSGPERKLDIIG